MRCQNNFLSYYQTNLCQSNFRIKTSVSCLPSLMSRWEKKQEIDEAKLIQISHIYNDMIQINNQQV